MSTSALSTLPPHFLTAALPAVPAVLAAEPVNWTAFGATVAACLLVMWARDRHESFSRRAFSFIGAITGGWMLPPVLAHAAPPHWLRLVPMDAPQTWALAAVVCGIFAASFFRLLVWAAQSALHRSVRRVDVLMNVIGKDDSHTPAELEAQTTAAPAAVPCRKCSGQPHCSKANTPPAP